MRDLSIEFGAVGFATLTPQAEAALRRLPLEARSHLRGVLVLTLTSFRRNLDVPTTAGSTKPK